MGQVDHRIEKRGFPLGYATLPPYDKWHVDEPLGPLSMDKIEDFGAHIAGARKELYARWHEALTRATQATAQGDGMQRDWGAPLSDLWPEPNYERMAKTGDISREALDWARALRDELGAKPRTLTGAWMRRCAALQGACLDVLAIARTGGGPLEFKQALSRRLNTAIDLSIVPGVSSTLTLMRRSAANREQSDLLATRARVMARAELYSALGHEVSLKEIETIRPGVFTLTLRKSATDPRRHYEGESWADIAQKLRAEDPLFKLKQATEEDHDAPHLTFSRIQYQGKPGVYLATKHSGRWVSLFSFSNTQAADRWLVEQKDAREILTERFMAIKNLPNERTEENRPRTGTSWREDGHNVTPDEFLQTFGFRGVQFGNYVEATRRQDDLNNCHDALMDLARVLDVPPRALALNGALALSFGARGKGGKNAPMAHFEPSEWVINLTKNKGAGSLAHEWFHAWDAYLARTPGTTATPNAGYLTMTREGSQALRAPDFVPLVDRSKTLDSTRKTPYWAKANEVGARSFEAYVREALSELGEQNDYLVNIRSEQDWTALRPFGQDDYPYPKREEISGVSARMRELVGAYRAITPGMEDGFEAPEEDAAPQPRLMQRELF